MLEWKRGGFPAERQECLCKLKDNKFQTYLILTQRASRFSMDGELVWYDDSIGETFRESEIECWIPLSEIINAIQ